MRYWMSLRQIRYNIKIFKKENYAKDENRKRSEKEI